MVGSQVGCGLQGVGVLGNCEEKEGEEQEEMVENILESRRDKQGTGKRRLRESICIVNGKIP